MIIASAQIRPYQSIPENLSNHQKYIFLAAQEGVQVIVFPEMSLTGYLRESASDRSFIPNDVRLDSLIDLATRHNITIIAGAPIKIHSQLHIGSFIISPNAHPLIYTKQFLHEGEEKYFTPNNKYDPVLIMGEERLAFAVCADISHPEHPSHASKKSATLYLASLFYTPDGIVEAHAQLRDYAKIYQMNILMSNYSGVSNDCDSAGESAFWNKKGESIAKCEKNFEGLLIVEKSKTHFQAKIIRN